MLYMTCEIACNIECRCDVLNVNLLLTGPQLVELIHKHYNALAARRWCLEESGEQLGGLCWRDLGALDWGEPQRLAQCEEATSRLDTACQRSEYACCGDVSAMPLISIN